MTKEGYQPIKKEVKTTPPNTGSHVKMKECGYTWEEVDKSYWEGFDTAKENMLKEITELKTEKIPQLERKIASIRGAHSVDCKKLKARTEQVERLKKENAGLRKQVGAMSKALVLNVPEADEKLDKAKEIILKLYNAGRDVLMCKAEEKAYDNLTEAINDRSIERFLKEE